MISHAELDLGKSAFAAFFSNMDHEYGSNKTFRCENDPPPPQKKMTMALYETPEIYSLLCRKL